MLTMTAPPAWRAISPVSRVTVCWPHWNVLVTLLNMLMLVSPVVGAGASRRDAIPRVLPVRNIGGMTHHGRRFRLGVDRCRMKAGMTTRKRRACTGDVSRQAPLLVLG